MSQNQRTTDLNTLEAFLIVMDGDKWRDVYRLSPSEPFSIGRAPTNRVVLTDEKCSRNHCQINWEDGQWNLTDLGSSNGTKIDEIAVTDTVPLGDQCIVKIGSTLLAFTEDLSRPVIPGLESSISESEISANLSDTNIPVQSADSHTGDDSSADDPDEEEVVVQQRGHTQFASAHDTQTINVMLTHQLSRLYRLAIAIGRCEDSKTLCRVVLECLIDGTSADIAAILVVDNPNADRPPRPKDLRLFDYVSSDASTYHTVSKHLSKLVLDSREAVMAINVSSHASLRTSTSLGELDAKSVICAPIRLGDRLIGILHLYASGLVDTEMESVDLEFALAVADEFAFALDATRKQEAMANDIERVKNENKSLRELLEVETDLIGDSKLMRQLIDRIGRVATSDATVLVRGESGVGKELVARAIHFNSPRREGPFICLNCAALTESLLESELFGHEKGAFTGATDQKRGKFEQADGGTLFLDEAGEMGLSLQAKFLRVLEGHAFERVGGSKPIKANVRVVAATNRNLEEAVKEGKFRKDLYFRLNVLKLEISPLRCRTEDVPLLVDHFLKRSERKTGVSKTISQDAIDMLTDYNWPGNVRELLNVMERALVLAPGDVILPEDIDLFELESPSTIQPPSPKFVAKTLQETEKERIQETLNANDWNKRQTARILGIERSTLDRKIERYELSQSGQPSKSVAKVTPR